MNTFLAILLAFPSALPLAPQLASEEVPPAWRSFPGAAEEFTSFVAGDLTGDGLQDLAFLCDPETHGELRIVCGVAWYHDPDDHVFEEVLSSGLTDLALLAGAGVDGADALVAVSSQGLHVFRQEGNGNWDEVVHDSMGALEHVAVWCDGEDELLIAATSPDGWVYPFKLDASQQLEEASTPFSTGGSPIDALLLFNRNSDGEPEIAFTRDSGLVLYEWDGTYIATVVAYPFGSGVLATALPTPHHGEERLALVTRELAAPYTSHWLRVLHDEGGTLVLGDPLDIGGATPLSIAAGDWSADGALEVALGCSELSLRLFEDQGNRFLELDSLALELPEASGEIRAMLLQDLDHDGDADGFFVNSELQGAVLHRSDAVLSASLAPPIRKGTPVGGELEQGFYSVVLELLSTPLNLPTGANELALVVWNASQEGVASGESAAACLATITSPFDSLVFEPTVSIPDYLGPTPATTHDYWVIEARYRRNVPGEPVLAYPTWFGNYTLKADWPTPDPEPKQGAARAAPPGGHPSLRGDLGPLDEIPPYEETPMNP